MTAFVAATPLSERRVGTRATARRAGTRARVSRVRRRTRTRAWMIRRATRTPEETRRHRRARERNLKLVIDLHMSRDGGEAALERKAWPGLAVFFWERKWQRR